MSERSFERAVGDVARSHRIASQAARVRACSSSTRGDETAASAADLRLESEQLQRFQPLDGTWQECRARASVRSRNDRLHRRRYSQRGTCGAAPRAWPRCVHRRGRDGSTRAGCRRARRGREAVRPRSRPAAPPSCLTALVRRDLVSALRVRRISQAKYALRHERECRRERSARLRIDLAGSLSRSDAAHELDFKRTKQSSAGKSTSSYPTQPSSSKCRCGDDTGLLRPDRRPHAKATIVSLCRRCCR